MLASVWYLLIETLGLWRLDVPQGDGLDVRLNVPVLFENIFCGVEWDGGQLFAGLNLFLDGALRNGENGRLLWDGVVDMPPDLMVPVSSIVSIPPSSLYWSVFALVSHELRGELCGGFHSCCLRPVGEAMFPVISIVTSPASSSKSLKLSCVERTE